MPEIEVPRYFKPRNYQLDLFRALEGIGQPQKKRALLRWHRQSGKDMACFAYMCYKAVQVPGNYFYFFPEYSQGRRALWEKIDKSLGVKFLEFMPDELISRRNNQDMLLELKNKSTIRIVGSDNYNSVVGIGAAGLVFSEFAYSDPIAWDKMRPVAQIHDAWVIFNSTPNGRNHMYTLENNVRKMNSWYVSELQTLWPEKPNYSSVVSPANIDEERASGMEEDMIEQEYGVSYTAGIKGSFYADVIGRAHNDGRIGVFPHLKHGLVDTYWDLGSTDDTAIWFVQRSGGSYVFIDYLENSGLDVADYAELLSDKGYNYGTHFLPWDGGHKTVIIKYSAKTMLEYALKDYKLSADVVLANRVPVLQGIQAVRSIFERCYFNEGTTSDGLKKIEAYHRRWDTKKQAFMKEPVHDWSSHAADALRTFGYFEVLEYGPHSQTGMDEEQVGLITDFDPTEDD